MPGARLYLAGGELLGGDALARKLRPSLPRQTTVADALLWVGIDARQYGQNEGIVLLRPERVVPHTSLAARAIDLEIGQLPDVDQYFEWLSPPGSLFFHAPLEARLASFDEKCPLRPCHTWLATEAVPSAWQNRRRFVHSLATLDAQVIVDGGWLLPMGQEDSLRQLVAVYRQLPAMRMERVAGDGGRGAGGGQTVTVRCGSRGDRTYVYLVNDASFPATARLRVEAPAGCRVQELTGSRPIAPLRRDAEGTYWDVELGPYDVVAAELSAPGVRFYRPEVVVPREVEMALDKQVRDLGYRAAAPAQIRRSWMSWRTPASIARSDSQNQIPGWIRGQKPGITGVTIQLDTQTKYSGAASVRLASSGPAVSLVSHPFAPPVTGRLAMLVRMRVADAAKQPPVRLVIEGRYAARTVAYYARFGQSVATNPGLVPDAAHPEGTRPIGTEWGPYLMEVIDLPLDTLSAMRVRLELSGAGEVWIDDVQLCDLAFNPEELNVLRRLIAPVQPKFQNGELGDCIHMLEGYWPRLLAEKVRLTDAAVTANLEEAPPQQPAAKHPKRSAGVLEHMRNLVPERLRF